MPKYIVKCVETTLKYIMKKYEILFIKLFKFYLELFPFKYNPKKFKNTFLAKNSNLKDPKHKDKINKVIWCFWTGENEIPSIRLESIEQLKKNAGVEIKLITKKTLPKYILKEDPLPKCYNNLSDVHKADFLRAYFLHHYGGGYTDIKKCTHSWIDSFKMLENSDAYGLGYSEIGLSSVGQLNVKNTYLRIILLLNYEKLIGCGAFIFRAKTKFTEEWLNECKNKLENYSSILEENPATNPVGSNENYPIPWTNILAEIVHPLCLKYNDKIIQDDRVKPILKNYK